MDRIVTALVYALFGRGHQDLVWAFQQVGSLTFGLTHLSPTTVRSTDATGSACRRPAASCARASR